MTDAATPPDSGGPQDPPDATLVFREQADGRKLARLPGGKIVLVDHLHVQRVGDGETWFVRLRHRDSFAIAEPVERRADGSASEAGEAPAAETTVPTVGVDIARLVRPSDRVAIFVDGANTDGAARAAGYFIDFRRAREFFVGPARFYAAFYYVADFTASDPLQQRFFDLLSHAGYIVRRRPVKVIADPETGERIIKGNLDTEIVLDLLNTVDNYDVAFLFSGDSDFERAVELLRSRGKRVFVVSARGPLSRELSYVADKPIVYLEQVRGAIARTDGPAAAR